jgi:hypothetical protein
MSAPATLRNEAPAPTGKLQGENVEASFYAALDDAQRCVVDGTMEYTEGGRYRDRSSASLRPANGAPVKAAAAAHVEHYRRCSHVWGDCGVRRVSGQYSLLANSTFNCQVC